MLFCQSCPVCFKDRVSHLDLGITNYAGLAGQLGSGILLSLSPTQILYVCHHAQLLCVYGDQIEVLMPAQQTLYPLSYFPTRQILLLSIFLVIVYLRQGFSMLPWLS